MMTTINKSNSMRRTMSGRFMFFESSISWISFVIIISCGCSCLYLLHSVVVNRHKILTVQNFSSLVTQCDSNTLTVEQSLLASSTKDLKQSQVETEKGTQAHPKEEAALSRVVFAIAGAAKNWPNRKEYVKKWYNSAEGVRAIIWLDKKVNETWEQDAPPYKISGDTSRFPYTFKGGRRSAVRLARIVSETFRLELPNVGWFVMGDDDTFFFPMNLVKVLSKYDHRKMYYIGSNSESHIQNVFFSFKMAFGGGGFAISYRLAKELATMQDSCLMRYPHLYGSDDRIFACMSELGVSLTKESGFHQMDIQGDPTGLLATHPQTPLVSIHHMDLFYPIFPNRTRLEAMDHLLKAAEVEPYSLLQQSICYADHGNWSISISWGYVVQVYKGFLTPTVLEIPLRTFNTIRRKNGEVDFPFNTRPVPEELCMRPTLYYMQSVNNSSARIDGFIESIYTKTNDWERQGKCAEKLQPLTSVHRIRVLKEPTMDSWFETPRRSCCQVKNWSTDSIEVQLTDCQHGETSLGIFEEPHASLISQ